MLPCFCCCCWLTAVSSLEGSALEVWNKYMLAPAASGGSVVCGLDLPDMLLVWAFQALSTVPNWMLKGVVSGGVCMSDLEQCNCSV